MILTFIGSRCIGHIHSDTRDCLVSRDTGFEVARRRTTAVASYYIGVPYLMPAATVSVSVSRRGLLVAWRDLPITFFLKRMCISEIQTERVSRTKLGIDTLLLKPLGTVSLLVDGQFALEDIINPVSQCFIWFFCTGVITLYNID